MSEGLAGEPGGAAARGSPFLSSTGAHHHRAAPPAPRSRPHLPARPAPGASPRRRRLPGLRAGEAWPPGPGGGLRSWEGAPRPADRARRPKSAAPSPPPRGGAASPLRAPARPALARGPGPAPPPDPGNTNRRRLARPRSLSPTSPSSSPRLGSSSRAGRGGRRGMEWDPGQGMRPPRRRRAAGCRAAGTGLRLAGPAAPSTGRAAAAALPGCPSPC